MNVQHTANSYRRAAAAVVFALSGLSLALVAGCSANDGGGQVGPVGPAGPTESIGSFSSTPATQGSTSMFSWTTAVPSSCSLQGVDQATGQVIDSIPASKTTGSGNSGTATSKVFTSGGVYAYTLSCVPVADSNATPVKSTLGINVASSNPGSNGGPAINTFGADTNPAQPNQPVTLSWTTTGAKSCSLVQGTDTPQPVAANGSQAETAPATNGTYKFTLICQAQTGSGTSSSTYPLVVFSNSTPPSGPTITGFEAKPQTVNIGDTTDLIWSTTDATACTVAGTDPYGNAVTDSGLPETVNGAQAASDTYTTAAYIAGQNGKAKNGTGVYTYTLTCQDASGTTSTSSAQVFVVASGAPTTTISPLAAQPGLILQGAAANTSALTWSHPEAVAGNSACTLSGKDPNGTALTGAPFGAQPASSSSAGVPSPAQTVVGNYTYSLACTNSQTNKVEQPDVAQVQVVDPNTVAQPLATNLNEVTSGDAVTLTWNHPKASACTAAEIDPNGNAVTGTGAFTGSQAVDGLNTGFTTGALTVVGNYTFSLNCTNADGSTNAVDPPVTVTVDPANTTAGLCGPAQIKAGTATPFLNAAAGEVSPFSPTAKASGLLGGGLLPGLMGTVKDLANVVDPTATGPAVITVPVGLLGGGEAVTVTNVAGTTYPKGSIPGFVIQVPNQGLGAGVLQNVSITTLLNGAKVDTTNVSGSQGGAVKVKALPGLVNSSTTQQVAFATISGTASGPYNAIQVSVAGVANVLNQLSVYYACVAQGPASP